MRARVMGVLLLVIVLVAVALKFFLGGRDKSYVKLTLVCVGGAIPSPIIDPDPAEITDRSKHFTWALVGGSNVVQATIIPKGSNPWPFKGNDYPIAKPDAPGKSNLVKDGIAKGVYKYSIEALCPLAGGGTHTVTIDPDMIIPKEN